MFCGLKRFLANPLVLRKPKPNKRLLLYILVSEDVVGVALVQESNSQQLVYFANKVLYGAETRY